MNLKKIAGAVAFGGAVTGAVLGFGSGLATADPGGHHGPIWPVPGPGVNVGGPGNPLPPGQHGFPPPGHRDNLVIPVWAPAKPPSPPWAPWLPVEWNWEMNAWGVYWNGGFQTL
jgi:hypothetical protein